MKQYFQADSMNIEVNIIVKINNVNLSYMIALNTCIGMSKILSLLKFLGQGKINPHFKILRKNAILLFPCKYKLS